MTKDFLYSICSLGKTEGGKKKGESLGTATIMDVIAMYI